MRDARTESLERVLMSSSEKNWDQGSYCSSFSGAAVERR